MGVIVKATGLSIEETYSFMEDDIKSLEILERSNNISEWGMAKLNEFRLIKRQLEILELIKDRLEENGG